MTSKVLNKSSKQKTQNIEKNSLFKRIGRKCTKYNFVAPLSFTDSYSSGIDQNFRCSSNFGLEQKFPN